MLSPARRHLQRVKAAKQAAIADAEMPQTGDQYHLMKAALTEDRHRLHQIQSLEKKLEVKAEILPQYQAYIDGVLESGNGAHDDVLMILMIWHIDIGDLDRGLEIARYALEHQLPAPDNHRRTTSTIVAEEVAELYLRKAAAKEDISEGIDHLTATEKLTDGHDMPDQARAKLHKALGFSLRDGGNLEGAIHQLKRALELDERSGVKSELARLEKATSQA